MRHSRPQALPPRSRPAATRSGPRGHRRPHRLPHPRPLGRWGAAAVIAGSLGAGLVTTAAPAGAAPTTFAANRSFDEAVVAAVPPVVAAVAPVTTTATPVTPATPAGVSSDLARLRECESGSTYAEDTGNGFYGAYQFDATTWHGMGYSGLPSGATPADQDAAAARLEAARGWEPWPSCSRQLGLRRGGG